MDGLQSPQVDAILKTLKDDKIWDAMVMCDGKNKNMLGGGPAPGVGLQNMAGVGPAPGVGLPNMLGVGPAPGAGLPNMPGVGLAPGAGLPNMPGVGLAPGVALPNMPAFGPAPGVGVPIMVGVGPAPGVGFPIMAGVGPDDPQVIKVAKWAVTEKKRKYVSLFAGLKWKLVVGTIYAIVIINRDDKREYTSGATVMEISTTGTKKLTIWKDINGAQD